MSSVILPMQKPPIASQGEGCILAFQCHDNTRMGWFFTNGKGIPIRWEKMSDFEPTRFYDEFDNEIEFNTGKTMILIIQDGDTFIVDGKRIS